MKYRIIATGGIVGLAKDVQAAIDEGWKPIGGVAVSANSRDAVVMQALVKDLERME